LSQEMDELTPLVSKPCALATHESCSDELMYGENLSSAVDVLGQNEDCDDTNVVVGVNPASSQQARMEELKLLKSRGITRKESVKMSPYERLSDINENASEKNPMETRKKHFESMEYLQNPLSSQQAKVDHQARMEELKLLKLDSVTKHKSLAISSGANSSDANSPPNAADEGKRTKHLLESMEYLQNPLSSQQAKLEHQARMEEVKLLKLNGITKEKSLNLTPSEGITDMDSFHSSLKSLKEARKKQHHESMEYLHRYQNNEVASKKSRPRQNDCPPIVSPATSQDSLPERRDSPEPEDSKDEVKTDPLKCGTVEPPCLVSETVVESERTEHQEDEDHIDCNNEVSENSDSQNMDEENACLVDSGIDAKSSGMDIDEINMNEDYSQENVTTNINQERATISLSQKRNASMSVESIESHRVSSPRSQKHARGTVKSRNGDNARPKRATRRTKPRFENYISSFSSDRDASIDSNRPRSVASQSSMTSKSTIVSQKPAPVPLYESSVRNGIRKNMKRDISDCAVCTLKWDPKAHPDLSGCERCLSFASEKELSAYHIKGHHHRIMMTRGGCKKCCKLFPRKSSLPAPRLCQRCFHDTHTNKLW